MRALFQPILRPVLLVLLTCAVAAAQPAGDATPDDAPPITDPTIKAAIETPREAPDDYARAVFVLIDSRQPALAKPILNELIGLGLDDAAKAALVDEFGSFRFVRLSRAEGMGPEAAEFAANCLEAAKARLVDPDRLAELVTKLASKSESTQAAALAAIRRTGRDGVRYFLAQMPAADNDRRNALREALVALAPLSRPALVSMLDSSDGELRKQAAWALGKLGDEASAPLLAARVVLEPAGSKPGRAAAWAFNEIDGAAVSSSLATRLLDTALQNARQGVPPARADADGRVIVYQRGADQSLATDPILVAQRDAGVIHAARLARLRLRVDPSNARIKQTALVLDLEARSIFEQFTIDPPADEMLDLATLTNAALGEAMAEALRLGYSGAAAQLAVKLGDRGDAAVLITGDGRPSPLADALTSPHPAVRFAGLRGVIGLKPSGPFPGSSRVAGALIEFAGSGATRQAVVAMPNIERAVTVAGYLTSAGIEGRPTNNGAEAVDLAASIDTEFVLVDLAILRPSVRETVFRLRRQTATGLVPIGLLAPAGRLLEAKEIADDHSGVLTFSRPHNAEAVAEIADALAEAAPAGWPNTEDRAELAEVARGWLAELLEQSVDGGPTFYNLRGRSAEVQRALVRVDFDEVGVKALAILGTPESQRELLSYVGLESLPIESRQAAAAAFKRSAERFGVLLTTDQIERQYERYNASETSDAETQKVLGDVLDTIEARRKKAAERRALSPLP